MRSVAIYKGNDIQRPDSVLVVQPWRDHCHDDRLVFDITADSRDRVAYYATDYTLYPMVSAGVEAHLG